MHDKLTAQIDAFFSQGMPDRLGVAVSGGSDSVALLMLLSRLPTDLHCVTVDHGLRETSAQEAGQVASLCDRLNVPHSTLRWTGWDGIGNVQGEARAARYGLMSDWAKEQDICDVALGHTLDDQAETVLMRLARGAGVDGLSAMAPRRSQDDVTWLRPLLGATRAELRNFLGIAGVSWIDDPTNDDERFTRIKVRQSWETLAPLGLTPVVLAQVAENMSLAREALAHQASAVAKEIVSFRAGAVEIARDGFDTVPQEIARRVFLAALTWVNGAVYPPRRRTVEAALAATKQSGSATLDGCHVLAAGPSLWIFREFSVVRDMTTSFSETFDDRWRLSGPDVDPNCHVGALGEEGLAQCPEWRALGVPRQALLPTPAIWNESTLVAAPVVDPASPWRADLENQSLEFF